MEIIVSKCYCFGGMMGEIAEDMLDGTTCQLCGCFFEENGKLYTHGFPVVCWDCWDDLSDGEKKNHQKAAVETL